MADHISAWSSSRADTYLTCARRAKFKFVDKIPELPRALPRGKTEHANERGSRIHAYAEKVVQHNAPISAELWNFKEELEKAQELYQDAPEMFEMEHTWCFDREWLPVNKEEYDKIWVRVIIDLFVRLSPMEALVIDHKSGKKWGNEVKHQEQMLLYVFATFIRFPDIQFVTAELWYLDVNELTRVTMTREDAMKLFHKFNSMGLQICSDRTFAPRPSLHACRFCPYRKGSNKWVTGTGDCELNPADKTELPETTWRQLRNEAVLKLKEKK